MLGPGVGSGGVSCTWSLGTVPHRAPPGSALRLASIHGAPPGPGPRVSARFRFLPASGPPQRQPTWAPRPRASLGSPPSPNTWALQASVPRGQPGEAALSQPHGPTGAHAPQVLARTLLPQAYARARALKNWGLLQAWIAKVPGPGRRPDVSWAGQRPAFQSRAVARTNHRPVCPALPMVGLLLALRQDLPAIRSHLGAWSSLSALPRPASAVLVRS